MIRHGTIPIIPLMLDRSASPAPTPPEPADAAEPWRAWAEGPCPVAMQAVGPQDEVSRVLAALSGRLGFPADAPERAGVCALRIRPGEVELETAWPTHGRGAAWAESAFLTLRGMLPDTDIYVTHRHAADSSAGPATPLG